MRNNLHYPIIILLTISLSLSFNNLLTKKGRTFLTAFAGSIGIIGIALILSLSNGINQFIAKKFNPRCATSVSAQFVSKIINFPELEKSIKFDIWDTVGQEKYRSLAKIFYKDAKVIIFVYDITKEFSFNSVKSGPLNFNKNFEIWVQT